jgi:tripartite-type tricarboxylate transporter receptor subunit TctC
MSSFEPICLLAVTPMFIIVNRDAPYRTLLELLEAARREPGKLTLASLSPATAQHIAIESLKRLANADINFVPYSGTVPAIKRAAWHVTSALANFPDCTSQRRHGPRARDDRANSRRLLFGGADGHGIRVQRLRGGGLDRTGCAGKDSAT